MSAATVTAVGVPTRVPLALALTPVSSRVMPLMALSRVLEALLTFSPSMVSSAS
ncbi:hypothetical protein D3C76_1876120 [compost metagenome]